MGRTNMIKIIYSMKVLILIWLSDIYK